MLPRYLILQCQGMVLNMITALQTTEVNKKSQVEPYPVHCMFAEMLDVDLALFGIKVLL